MCHLMHPFLHFVAFSSQLCVWLYFWRKKKTCMCMSVPRFVYVMISKYNWTSTLNKLIGKINSSRWPFYMLWSSPHTHTHKKKPFHCLLISNGKTISIFAIPHERKIEFSMSNFSQLAYDEHEHGEYHTMTVSGRKFLTIKFERRVEGK